MPPQRLVRIGAAAAAAFVVAASAWAIVQAVGAPESRERADLPAAPAGVAIEVDQGDVDVRADPDAAGVSARADVRTVVAPERSAAMVDGEARLSWTCRLWTTCRADVRARIPSGVPTEVRTDFGDIRVAGPAGDVDLETGSGDVEAHGIAGARATVRARSGGARLGFARPPRAVDVEVSSGDVVVAVPAGAYRIEAETRAGDVTLDGVRHDDGARGRIVLDTTAGDVTVKGRGG